MPAHELARPIGHRVGAGDDRLVGEEAVEVLGELLGRDVAARGVLLQRLEDDRLEVARHAHAPATDAGSGLRQMAEPGRIDLADHALELAPAVLAEDVRGRPPTSS